MTTASSTTSEVVTIGQRRRRARLGWARWLRRARTAVMSVPFSLASASAMSSGSRSSTATMGRATVIDGCPSSS